jgi:hypothetical protein
VGEINQRLCGFPAYFSSVIPSAVRIFDDSNKIKILTKTTLNRKSKSEFALCMQSITTSTIVNQYLLVGKYI